MNWCTSSINVMKNFLGNDKKSIIFWIEALNEKPISNYTEDEDENEVIWCMDIQIRVKIKWSTSFK